MSKTVDNLWEAFAGESQANRKYLAFAEKADKEGYTQAARLFRAAAAAETVHAHNHLRALDFVKSTAENLQEGINGEHYESSSMYPPFLEEAIGENNKAAMRTFKFALEVEKTHEKLYTEMFENLCKEKEEDYAYYVCPVCGYTHPRNAPDVCPVCGAKGERFMRVE
jgi:rubrerythrin